jgi:hypothetical protein
MVAKGEIDARLVSLLDANYDAIHLALVEAQAQSVREYETFQEALKGGEETPSRGMNE